MFSILVQNSRILVSKYFIEKNLSYMYLCFQTTFPPTPRPWRLFCKKHEHTILFFSTSAPSVVDFLNWWSHDMFWIFSFTSPWPPIMTSFEAINDIMLGFDSISSTRDIPKMSESLTCDTCNYDDSAERAMKWIQN